MENLCEEENLISSVGILIPASVQICFNLSSICEREEPRNLPAVFGVSLLLHHTRKQHDSFFHLFFNLPHTF